MIDELTRLLSPRALGGLLVGVAREDPVVFRSVCLVTSCQFFVIGWDLPGLVGWENDGMAPRSFFSGVGKNLTPGDGYRYPLFHSLVLLVACLPVLAVCMLSGAPGDVVERVRSLPAMTACSLIVKALHVLMGGAELLVLARIARRLFGQLAGRATVLAWAACLTVGYYARSTNLDGPYMFWTVLAVDRTLSVCETARSRDFKALGVFVALSVATKDQAYASYVLTLPLYLVALPVALRLPDRAARLQRVGQTLFASLATYAVAGGVILNPTGFVARVRMLMGPNSQEWRSYERSATGVLLNLEDLWSAQPIALWGWGLALLAWGGLLVASLAPSAGALRTRVYRLMPLVAGGSSLVAFTLAVARADHRSDQRFLLPLGTWLCVYAGAAMAWLARPGRLRVPALAGAGLALTASYARVVLLALTQWGDARWQVTEMLATLPPGSRVEVYGTTAYLPQLDLSAASPYRVQRLEKRPVAQRSRLPGMEEIEGEFTDVERRGADVLVVSEAFADLYLPRRYRVGESQSVVRARYGAEHDGVSFFVGAVRGHVTGYNLVCALDAELPALARRLGAEPIRVHDSTGQRQWLFARPGLAFRPSCGGQGVALSSRTAAPAR